MRTDRVLSTPRAFVVIYLLRPHSFCALTQTRASAVVVHLRGALVGETERPPSPVYKCTRKNSVHFWTRHLGIAQPFTMTNAHISRSCLGSGQMNVSSPSSEPFVARRTYLPGNDNHSCTASPTPLLIYGAMNSLPRAFATRPFVHA